MIIKKFELNVITAMGIPIIEHSHCPLLNECPYILYDKVITGEYIWCIGQYNLSGH